MSEDLFEKGLEIRCEVLGREYVENSLKNSDEFSRPLQELVTKYGWGEVWARPGISRKTRSLINIAMITALNRPHELTIHVRGALNNGCTKEEIREVLLQTAVYCGMPAALDSFRVVQAAFKDMENTN